MFLISKATNGEDVGSIPAWGTIKFTQTIVLRKLMRQQQLSSPATKSQISSSYILGSSFISGCSNCKQGRRSLAAAADNGVNNRKGPGHCQQMQQIAGTEKLGSSCRKSESTTVAALPYIVRT